MFNKWDVKNPWWSFYTWKHWVLRRLLNIMVWKLRQAWRIPTAWTRLVFPSSVAMQSGNVALLKLDTKHMCWCVSLSSHDLALCLAFLIHNYIRTYVYIHRIVLINIKLEIPLNLPEDHTALDHHWQRAWGEVQKPTISRIFSNRHQNVWATNPSNSPWSHGETIND